MTPRQSMVTVSMDRVGPWQIGNVKPLYFLFVPPLVGVLVAMGDIGVEMHVGGGAG